MYLHDEKDCDSLHCPEHGGKETFVVPIMITICILVLLAIVFRSKIVSMF